MDPSIYRKIVRSKLAVIIFVVAAGGILILLRYPNWRHVAEQQRAFEGVARNWQPPLLLSLFFVGLVVILLLWKLPKLQAARSKALTDENRFDRENEARKTLAQILGGVFLLAGLYSSVQTFNLAREGQITDRFTKAIEQLGATDAAGVPRLEVRLGGIYALERIARDSERDHRTIMEVFTTYVREHSPRKKDGQQTEQTTWKQQTTVTAQDDKPQIGPDIQAILTVLGRREVNYDIEPLNLNNTDLLRADLSRADLSRANLSRADLSRAALSGANLHEANLFEADLTGATLIWATLTKTILVQAHLTKAILFEAHLTGAILTGADLTGADLTGADLSGANLNEANLTGAHLTRADLSGANLSGANLNEANLSGANLRDPRGLTQEQIDASLGDASTALPSDLKKPESWRR